MVRFLSKRAILVVVGLVIAMAALACGPEAQEPTERIVTVPVEVEKIVEVERVVEVPVEVQVEKIVEVERVVQATPDPQAADSTPAAPTGPAIYKMGLFEDPISRNVWNYLGGPAGSVWTGYVIGGYATRRCTATRRSGSTGCRRLRTDCPRH